MDVSLKGREEGTASVPLDGDRERLVRFVLASGMNGSALEHAVPEQMFSTPENPAEGISAVKALKIANDQGIPIYTVNRTNIDIILPQLEDKDEHSERSECRDGGDSA